jgi:mRNA interferase RelE/StbE
VSWTVALSSAAIKDLDRLPQRVVPAVIEFIFGPLAENPRRLGKPLRSDFTGIYSARRGVYRVLYEINEDDHSVTAVRIGYRGDAYR